MLLLILATLIVSVITGFVFSVGDGFISGLTGQMLHGLLSIVGFTLVGIAFWRFGWKVGAVDFVLLLIAGNIAFSVHRYLSNNS